MDQPAAITLPAASGESAAALDAGRAVAWSEPLTIRTYEAGEPSPFPMYLDHRVYQGSSGKVYPLPFVEHVADEGVDRQWQAVHLENEYVRLVVLPELGGRIHIGYDKVTGYDFFYRNNVIKPALVGLGGPWISGGVEFNWPQHHRPGTYLPVQTSIEHDEDGTVTVWCGDHDPFTRMSAQHGVRLRARSSVVELVVRLHNRTSERQSFLWWANVAARVHDDFQSFFPEDVRYVADHARRAITAFPRADRTYYGVDYPALAAQDEGADRIDFYRNIPVPTSYMIIDSQGDFFGGYDHAAGAGFVHWAERRLSPGKKQWTWGNAPFGHAWDAQLTDADGPYVELMAGVYTDNQPDFSWLLPGETKGFSQYWFPVPALGVVHQATPDAAVHVERTGGVTARFAVTSPRPGAVLRIRQGEQILATRTADLVPGVPVALSTTEAVDRDTAVELQDNTGRVLVRWIPAAAGDGEDLDDDSTGTSTGGSLTAGGRETAEPWVAEEPAQPEEITSVEELYLTGLHLAQYRHPTRSPLPYWRQALSRDPEDVRTNLAVADHYYRSGRYEPALQHVQTALTRLTRRNANPLDAEAFYLHGLVLARLGRTEEAERAFGKAGWDGTWSAAAGLELARSLARRRRDRAASRVLDTLDGFVGHDARRTALRVVLAGRFGRHAEAQDLLRAGLQVDPLDATLGFLASGVEVDSAGGADRGGVRGAVDSLAATPVASSPGIGDAARLLDVAADLSAAGESEQALHVLDLVVTADVGSGGNVRPVAHYSAAVLLDELGRPSEASARRKQAQVENLTWSFPYGLSAHDVLTAAIATDPDDGVAQFLLGMLLYAHGRRREAAQLWERCIALGMRHPVLLRNAGLAAYNVTHDDEKAWLRYEQAVAAAPTDARLRYEQDQLAARLGYDNASRLQRLQPVEHLVLTRDDLSVVYIGLLVEGGCAEQAHAILCTRSFHPWEGGEGQVLAVWDAALQALGMPSSPPPANLGETRPSYPAPAAVRGDGQTDYFATSLPALLLFARGDEYQ
ncbi:tetratricopeptide (TPR) repeat protein [Kineococcus radiotolerans]|uniref:Tetratricopeptide (TPR) repeat protein n=1 Tax=Kineococcus radiotolerans TaxID=131568 RepID=A0A7W4TQE1_KINRA|nr:DUF5107 domain-containing protein [Kineococcus radiotolerans]MBB2903157.1 tetratricopeptide (TPR) repeat protein [Kineococcus radiotolerans]